MPVVVDGEVRLEHAPAKQPEAPAEGRRSSGAHEPAVMQRAYMEKVRKRNQRQQQDKVFSDGWRRAASRSASTGPNARKRHSQSRIGTGQRHERSGGGLDQRLCW